MHRTSSLQPWARIRVRSNAVLAAASLAATLTCAPAALAVYSPPGFGLDMWYIREAGVWHQFTLGGPHPSDFDKRWPPLSQPEREPLPYFEQGIYHSTSTDLITWKDEGVILTIGKPDAWDGGKFASGGVCKHDGVFYLFYPGLRVRPLPDSCSTPIGVARSRDLIHWEKYSGNPVLVPDGKHYENTPAANWRDSSLVWDGRSKSWYAVICATAAGAGPVETRGCIGLARSTDLLHWEYLPPLVRTPQYTLGPELPFLIENGGRWYLGHSMYGRFYAPDWRRSHPGELPIGGVHYYVGREQFGPFIAPPGSEWLGAQPDPPPYAAQLIKQDGEWLFMHWGPVRYATALPKRVDFQADGRMRLRYWKGVEAARKESLLDGPLGEVRLDGERGEGRNVGRPATDCFFETTVSLDHDGAAGLRLGSALLLLMDAKTGRIGLADPATHEPRPERTVQAALDHPVRIRLVVDGSVVDVYADDLWLFAEHCPRPHADQPRLKAFRGAVTFKDVRLDRLTTGNRIHHYGFNY
jgi:beta-fructofuranosidase